MKKFSATLCAIAIGVADATLLSTGLAVSQGTAYSRIDNPPTWTDPKTGTLWEYSVFLGEGMMWRRADNYCKKFGGQLVSIHSKAEDDFIKTLPLNNREVWLGGGDEKVEGTYVWTDGTPMDYFGWARNNPGGNQTARDCVFLWRASETDGWGDASCGHALGYICKRHFTPKPVKGTHVETIPGKTTVVKRVVPNTSGAGSSSGSGDPDDDSIGTKLHIKVAWNSGMTDPAN